MKESMVFYRSFYEACEQLSDRELGEFCNAVFQYAFYGNREHQLTGIGRALFIALLPQIDANAQRHQQAVKGGQNRWNGRGRDKGQAPEEESVPTPQRPQKEKEQQPPVVEEVREQPAEQTPEMAEKTPEIAQERAETTEQKPVTRQYGKYRNVQLTGREYGDLQEHIPLVERWLNQYSKYKMANQLTALWDYDGMIHYYHHQNLPPGAFVRENGQVRGDGEALYDWERGGFAVPAAKPS